MKKSILLLSVFLMISGFAGFAQTYCTPTHPNSCTNDFIAAVSTSGGATNISYSTGSCPGGYANYFATQGVTAAQGSSITLTISRSSSYTEYGSAWVDWNQNGSFTDAGETVAPNTSLSTSGSPFTVTVPLSAAVGTTRLRIALNSVSNGETSCVSSNYGNTIDFYFTVTPAPAPPTFTTNPAGLSVCTGNAGSFTAAASGGPTYQWQRSNGGAYVNISSAGMDAGVTYAGFTTGTLTVTPTTTSANGYTYQVIATNTFGSTTSSAAALTVNATPVVAPLTGGAAALCTAGPSGTTTFSDATGSGVWSSTNTAAATVSGGTVTGVATGATTISYTVTSGPCSSAATATVSVTSTPTAVTVTPPSAVVCQNSATNLLTAAGGTVTTPGTATAPSGTVNLSVSANHATATSSVAISGVPATATISGLSVQIDFSSNFQNDYTFNLVAPNGQILNLIFNEGNHGNGSYTGTVISSTGVTALPSGTSPFSAGPYIADGYLAVGPSGYLSTVTGANWPALYSVPNGSWTLVAYNTTTFTNNPTTLQDWTMTVNYTYPQQMPVTWSPAPNLFTNSGGTTAYTGSNTLSLYENPLIPGVITYTATATNGACTSIGTTTVTVNPLPLPIAGTFAICNGATTTLSDPTPGGTWTSGNTSVASIFSGTGFLIGMSAGTAGITYTLPTGCIATASETINPLPGINNVTGGGVYCAGGTGVAIGLNGSSTGITYQLFNGTTPVGSPVAGTGSPISFGLQTGVGTYKVEATNVTTFCNATMNGTVTVSTNPLPNAHTVTGGGTYCAGGTGFHVGLNGSDLGINYQLYRGGSTVGGSVTGTGSALDFGIQTVAGTYTVVATNATTSCSTTMTGSAVIVVNAVPAPIGGAAVICAGQSTTLTDATTGGTWSSSPTTVATISSSGTMSGVAAGTAVISYTVNYPIPAGGSSCSATLAVTVNPLPILFIVSGGGTYCAGGTGYHIILSGSSAGVNYQLFNGTSAVGSPVAGNGSALDFGLQTAAGTYTVVATNTSTSCSRTMVGSPVITVNPLPGLHTVTGGGSYCYSGTGVHVGLNGSDAGINYQLYNGATAFGAPLAGTGSALDFGLQTAGGTYTVVATNATTGCSKTMTGSAGVTVLPLPYQYNVIGGGTDCAGGTGFDISLDYSDAGFTYQLYNGTTAVGAPLAGVDDILDFGLQTAGGTYTIVSTDNSTGCSNNMSGSAVIVVNPLPARYNVTGGGSYCAGGTGVDISLDYSDAGFTYQLYNGTTAVGGAMAGVDDILDFGNWTAAGTYWIMATNNSTLCTDTMNGSATVVINPLPPVHMVTGGGAYCAGGAGVTVGLNGSESGINYQLFRAATGLGITGGTGSAFLFSPQTVAGTYRVVATDATTSCADTMAGSAAVSINPLPTVYNVTGGGSYCSGGMGDSVGLSNSDAGFIYQLYNGIVAIGAPIPGSSSSISFGAQTLAGTYTVVATNTVTSCTKNMNGSATVTILPIVHPSVGITYNTPDSICAGRTTTFTAIPVYGGPAPHYNWAINDSVVGTDSSAFWYNPSDSNRISVTMISNHTCAVPDTVKDSVSLRVFPNEIPTVHILANPGDVVCRGTQVTYVAHPSYGGDNPVYAWIKNGAMISTAPSFTYTPADSDDVYCLMHSHYLCRIRDSAFSDAIYMHVEAPVVPSVVITARPGLTIVKGNPDTLIANVSNGGPYVSYQWYVNNGAVPAATTSVFIRSTYSNKDSVSCMVTRNDACSLSSVNSVILNVWTVGVDQVGAGNNISLAPNPNKGTFTLKGSLAAAADEEVTIEITNLVGQQVYTNKTLAKNGEINELISIDHSMASGIYLLNLRSQSGNNVFRFVVER